MAKLKVTAKLFTDEGKVAKNHNLSVQVYSAKHLRWINILNGKTNNSGLLSLNRADSQDMNANFIPMFRLVEAGNPGPRVLAQGAAIQFVKNQKLIRVDFGQIERLDETSYKRQHTGFVSNEIIAGSEKRPGISMLAVNRMMVSNPVLVANLATLGATAANVSANERHRLTSDMNVALLVNKEVQTLKAREKTLNSLVIDKEREVSENKIKLDAATAKISELKLSLETVKQKDIRLRDQLSNVTNNLKSVAKIDSVFSGVGRKIETANNKMKDEKIPFKVTGIKLDLRGSIINNGESMIFNGVPGADGKSTVGNSSLQAEILPTDDVETSDNVKVPDITGLTESACMRVINSIGLRVKKITEAIKVGATPGQAMRQHPAAGAEVERNSELLVVFAVAPTEAE